MVDIFRSVQLEDIRDPLEEAKEFKDDWMMTRLLRCCREVSNESDRHDDIVAYSERLIELVHRRIVQLINRGARRNKDFLTIHDPMHSVRNAI